MPDCPPSTSLSLHVNFPDCWDGKSLLSDNQRACPLLGQRPLPPKVFQVAMPALSLVLRYPVTTTDKTVELASGGQFSGHADFINTWNQPVLRNQLVAGCLNKYHCGYGLRLADAVGERPRVCHDTACRRNDRRRRTHRPGKQSPMNQGQGTRCPADRGRRPRLSTDPWRQGQRAPFCSAAMIAPEPAKKFRTPATSPDGPKPGPPERRR